MTRATPMTMEYPNFSQNLTQCKINSPATRLLHEVWAKGIATLEVRTVAHLAKPETDTSWFRWTGKSFFFFFAGDSRIVQVQIAQNVGFWGAIEIAFLGPKCGCFSVRVWSPCCRVWQNMDLYEDWVTHVDVPTGHLNGDDDSRWDFGLTYFQEKIHLPMNLQFCW